MLEEIGLLSGWLAEPPRCRLLPAGFLGPSLCCAFSMRRGRPVVTVVTLARGGRSGRARARGEIPARGCSCVFARGNSSPHFHLPIPPPPSPLNPISIKSSPSTSFKFFGIRSSLRSRVFQQPRSLGRGRGIPVCGCGF